MKKFFNLAAFLLMTVGASAQTWNFCAMSDADKTLLNADTQNWTHEQTSSEDRYNSTATNGGEGIALVANKTELSYAKGLKFTYNTGLSSKDKIRLNPNKATSGLQLNGQDIVMIIPNVKAGTVIEMNVRSGKSSEERGFTATNFTADADVSLMTSSKATIKGVATADGDVTFTTTAGMNVLSLTVSAQQSDDPTASEWNFIEMSDADKTLLEKDVEMWLHEQTSSEDRYNSTVANGGEGVALKASGTELAYAKGLRFTFNAALSNKDKIRLNPNKSTSGLQLNGVDIVMTIPNLKAGSTIEMEVRSGKSGEERGFTAENFTADDGTVLTTTTKMTIKGKATADGNVSFTTTAGMNVISLKVVLPSTLGIVTPENVKPAAKSDNRIFTLSGVEVKNPAKGIYIRNGKKFIVR